MAMQDSSVASCASRDHTQTTSDSAAHDDVVVSADMGVFFSDGARRIDFVLAFHSHLQDDVEWTLSRAEKRQIFEKALREHYGLAVEHELGVNDGKADFVKLHVPFATLCTWAEITLMRMPLSVDPSRTSSRTTLERALEGCCGGNSPFANSPGDQANEYTAIFTHANAAKFLNYNKPDVFFSPAQRSRLAHEILFKAHYKEPERTGASDQEEEGLEKTKIGVGRLLRDKSYVAAYPLHDGPCQDADGAAGDNRRAWLYRAWGNWRGAWYRVQPLDHIRDYYGEKIAIYFAWKGYYTSALLPPSIIGLIVFLIGCVIAYGGGNNVATQVCSLQDLNRSSPLCASDLGVDDLACRDVLMCPLCDSGCAYWHLSDACTYSKVTLVFDNPATVFFAAFMALWATFFLEFWKRQQNEIAYDWDVTDFEEFEEERPSFEAKVTRRRPNPATGKEEGYQSRSSYYGKMLAALSIVAFFVILVLAVLFSIVIYRVVVAQALQRMQASVAGVATTGTASVIQVLCITALGKVYEFLAAKLTSWELHRTQTEHEDSFAFKMFLFQFCNFYGSIFYIAFFKGNFAGYPPSYMKISSYRVDECGAGGCLIELTMQLAILMVHLSKRNNTGHGQMTRWEADYDLSPLPSHGMFKEYLESVLQYGFATLFVSAFPLAPLLALLNNVVEIRLDAGHLLTHTRRPFAARAQDIGIWQGILHALSTSAVITNGLVISLTSDFIPRLVYQYAVQDKQTIYGDHLGSNCTTDGFALYEISVTSSEVFKQVNATVHDQTNAGVIKSYLEQNSDLNVDNLVCGYRGPKRLTNQADGVADLTAYYWNVVAGRLAFLVAFEHVVFFVKAVIAWIVPDVPRSIRLQQEREAFLAATMLRDLNMHDVHEAC